MPVKSFVFSDKKTTIFTTDFLCDTFYLDKLSRLARSVCAGNTEVENLTQEIHLYYSFRFKLNVDCNSHRNIN